MTTVALDAIDENGHNIRTRPPTAEDDARLTRSIGSLGVLQPVLLRRQPENIDRFYIVAGHRRVRCARQAALEQIPAEILPPADAVTFAAIQAAENMVRVQMEPVDQWRSIVTLQEAGYTLAQAAGALGIGERKAKQLDKLGHIAPEILDVIAGDPAVDFDDVATIASAPIERQREAFRATSEQRRPSARIELAARHCIGTRISRALAIFDVDASSILFEEDLFAEPGSDEQFTTRDVAGFVAAQQAALVLSVNARKKKNERVSLSDWSKNGLKLPKGWDQIYQPIKKRYPAKGDEMLFQAVREDGYGIGGIVQTVAINRAEIKAKDKAKVAAPKAVEASESINEDADNDGADHETAAAPSDDLAEAEDMPLAKRGQTLLASIKTDALRDHLDAITAAGTDIAPRLSTLFAALIVALSSDNVSINDTSRRYGRARFNDLAAQVIGPGGIFLDLTDDQVATLAAQALTRMVRITDPVTGIGSGDPAEWIGAAIGAEAALPRFDTADFLGCMSKAALIALAAENGRTGLKTAAGIRQALEGSLPDWRPTSFGAPGPRATGATLPRDDDDDQEQAA